MKTTLTILVTAIVLTAIGSTLAIMNNACKSGHHGWCAPMSSLRAHTKNLGTG